MGRLVGLYVRVSRDDVGESTSTARQERLCRRYAVEQGWEVAEVFEDVDRSAYASGVRRESYERLLTAVTRHRFDAVVVWRLDRLVRSPAEFERVWAMCQRSGVAVVSATEPVDSSDPVGVAIIRMLVTFAGLESDVKSIRLRAKNRELAEAGCPHPGRRPYGHMAGMTAVVAEEAALIVEAADRVLGGESTAAIVDDWQARGVVGPTGRPWTRSGLRALLRSRRLVGERTYRGEVVATGCWAPILSPVTAAQVRNRLAGMPGGAQRRPSPSLLQGRVRCGLCATPMQSRGRRDRPRYACPPPRGCGRISIDRPALDEWITAAVLARLEARQPANHRTATDRRAADGVIGHLDHQSRRLEELNRRYFISADLTYPEWVRTRDDLLAATEGPLARSGVAVLPSGYPATRRLGEARELWDQLAPATQRAVIATELAWVSVDPARAHNGVWYPDRIHPRWYQPAPPGARGPDDRPRRLHLRSRPEAMRPERPEEPDVSLAEARSYLGVGRDTLRRLMHDGTLRTVTHHPRRVPTAALTECIEACRIYPSSEPSDASG